MLLSPYIDPGTVDTTAYNHFSLLRSTEDLFGLGHLGYAAQTGLQPLGPEAFTCFQSQRPRPRHGRLAAGSLIKLAVIGQGTAPRPQVELKLWQTGRVSITVGRRHVSSRTAAPCRLQRVRLPVRHGIVVITARAFGGVERRTISF